ncbi:glycosyltransferase [Pseudomonas sp. MMS21-TM103]|uniref:glycosyltransferase n=1 Tax=Pseudomonas sp. MMS21 TM103 TaxID=2886506 RepID=UPI001EDEF410|nr:glycosyltransferase [Pseudomonas sp. MMS21 TM103]MCG4455175.1 glycosyltransferase [Pseudomonas sp. MMS21 TM103]
MKNKIMYLGYYVGDEYFERYSKGDRFPQVAAYKLESRILNSLAQGGESVNVLGSIAVTTYPMNKRAVLPSGLFSSDNGQNGKIFPFINTPLLKMPSRFFSSIFCMLSRGRADAVFVYSAHSPYLLSSYVFSRIYKIPFFVFLPDLPLFMDMGLKRSFFSRFLKKLDNEIINFLVSLSSGVFVSTKYMIEDNPRWRSLPYLVVEGIAEGVSGDLSVDERAVLASEMRSQKVIFYAGGVNRSYGIRELVEGFIESNIDAQLWICGRGDLESYLDEVSARHVGVKYLGFLPPDDVLSIQNSCDLLVLSRDPKEKYTRYSFPSKLLEYMSSGVPVLTTKLEGIPEEYYEYLNIISEFSVAGIATALEEFFSIDETLVRRKSARGGEFVRSNKNTIAVGSKMVNFLNRCINDF